MARKRKLKKRKSSKRRSVKKSRKLALNKGRYLQKIIILLKKPDYKKWLFFLFKAGLILAALGIIFAVGVYIYFSKDLQDPSHAHQRNLSQSTKIFDRTGKVLLYEVHGEEKRTKISYKEMPEDVREGSIAAEDKLFYEHHGINFKSIIRALIEDIRHSSAKQGASTITQQFIKNAYLTPEKTITRKIKELILSIELERRYEKDEILEMYLNQIPYGSNAYGIEAAAQTYFEKNAKDLTLDESALLVALPKAPSALSPYGNNIDRLIERKNWILDRMYEEGFITDQQRKEAQETKTLEKIKPPKTQINAPHFVMYVKQLLVEDYGYEEEFIEKGGLRIYTTLDWEMQQNAEQIVKSRVEKNIVNFNAHNAALVAINPKTGEILSMVGSHDYFDRENDGNVNVALRGNQPGSSFKPFAYATAFAKGYTPDTLVYDVKTNFKADKFSPDYVPQNYDGSFKGPVKLRDALAMSLNIPAVKVLYLAGIDDTINTAEAMGITTLTERQRYGLALVLGGGDVTLLEETSAFGVFANDGIRQDKKAIIKIEDTKGKIIKEMPTNPGKRVLAAQVARQVNDCLSDNSARSPVFGGHSDLYISGKKIAAKTGTTQEYRDAWTVGYTPDVVVGVWAGNNYNEKMREGAGGIAVAAPIFHDFMERFIDKFSKTDFIKPKEEKIKKPMLGGYLEDTITLEIDKESDLIATDDCKDKYTKERTFGEIHCILYYVNRENPHGPFPEDPEDDPQFENWEKGVKAWVKENKDIRDKDEIPDPDKRGCDGDEEDDDDDDDDDD
ncbi:MAG: PBP1A family penicillin-binding protein [Candidatus Moranbacteria bacterium]|nr:PBP1A family penicillin-binding protein [Candidatus Moranbacteria bacterium]